MLRLASKPWVRSQWRFSSRLGHVSGHDTFITRYVDMVHYSDDRRSTNLLLSKNRRLPSTLNTKGIQHRRSHTHGKVQKRKMAKLKEEPDEGWKGESRFDSDPKAEKCRLRAIVRTHAHNSWTCIASANESATRVHYLRTAKLGNAWLAGGWYAEHSNFAATLLGCVQVPKIECLVVDQMPRLPRKVSPCTLSLDNCLAFFVMVACCMAPTNAHKRQDAPST